VRTVNGFNLKKGESYHLDLLVLSVIVFLQSITGLPWVCAATVQSLNHVRSMANTKIGFDGKETTEDIVETRLSGFVIHAAILGVNS
jgi:HCO3- transporter family